jgi:hypothetical protein
LAALAARYFTAHSSIEITGDAAPPHNFSPYIEKFLDGSTMFVLCDAV